MKNIATKMLNVIKDVQGTVGKSGFNSFQKYKYITEADITDAIRPALLKNNLAIFSSVIDCKEMSPAGKNLDQKIYQITFEHTLIDADSGESIKLNSVGTGADTLDKSVYKAFAGAFKYFIMKNFFISGDDDPENEGTKTTNSQPEAKPVAPQAPKTPIPGPKAPLATSTPDMAKELAKDQAKAPAVGSTLPKPAEATTSTKPKFGFDAKPKKAEASPFSFTKKEEPKASDEDVAF